MAEQENILNHLDEVFREMESRLNGQSGSSLHEFQKKSLEALKKVQFPDRKHEDWKNTAVQNLISPKYKLASYSPGYKTEINSGLNSYVLPVINGKLEIAAIDPGLKKLGISVSLLQEAFEDKVWNEVFSKWMSEDVPSANRAFEFLNYTFNSNGFYLSIPANLKLDKPIEIQIIHDDPEISFSHPLYFVHAGKGSQATVFERFENSVAGQSIASGGFINALAYFHLDQNAHLQHIKWQDLPSSQNLVYKLKVKQQRDSHFASFAFDKGGLLIRNNVDVALEESNTYTSLQAGYIAKGRQSMDHQTQINHKVPHGESHELYKGIIDEQGSGAFNGKVFVSPDAQKTNAFQQNDALVLSPHALVHSKPQLEIFADDVKCSHGATIGQLDDKAVFYLRSRGLDAQAAKEMLKSAFLATVVEAIPDSNIQQYIQSKMSIDV